jgi:hypothetical protein
MKRRRCDRVRQLHAERAVVRREQLPVGPRAGGGQHPRRRDRYRSGVATQLDMIQADRDAFAAAAGRVQSDAELLNARLQLRLAARKAR